MSAPPAESYLTRALCAQGPSALLERNALFESAREIISWDTTLFAFCSACIASSVHLTKSTLSFARLKDRIAVLSPPTVLNTSFQPGGFETRSFGACCLFECSECSECSEWSLCCARVTRPS